jgi:hypothetical protein
MAGTLLNIVTVFIGSLIGLLVGNRLSTKMQESVVTGLGLVTFFVGMQNTATTGNIIIPLLALVIGAIVGEIFDVDAALKRFAAWLQRRFAGKTANESQPSGAAMTPREKFITGFVTASLVFCVGPLTIVGSIQDGMGLAAGFQFLAIKSVLDGFAAAAFAASFGIGVMFTILTILVVQGGLALVGSLLITLMSDPNSIDAIGSSPMVAEMTAVGGLLLMGLSLILLDVKKPRVANFLPALIIAPVMVAVAQALGVPLYPL